MHIDIKSVDSFASWIHHERSMAQLHEKRAVIEIFQSQEIPLKEDRFVRQLHGLVPHPLIKKIVKAANKALYHPEMKLFFEQMAEDGRVGRFVHNKEARETICRLFSKACSGNSLKYMFTQIDLLKNQEKITGTNARYIKELAVKAYGEASASAPSAASAVPDPERKGRLTAVYKETMDRAHEGYMNGRHQKVNPNELSEQLGIKEGTQLYGRTTSLPVPKRRFHTQFLHRSDDSINVALQLKGEGLNPVVLNLANAFHPGGGVQKGSVAQEEDLFRRSNMYMSLVPKYNFQLKAQVDAYKRTEDGRRMQAARPDKLNSDYLVPELGGIYSPNVAVFREDERHGFAFMDVPEMLPFIAVAAYNRKHDPKDRAGNADFGPTDERVYENNMKEKIRATLRIAADHGHEDVVLGALGCGAFRNDPRKISRYMGEVLHEPEFHDRFRTIAFAILPGKGPDNNYEIFRSHPLLQTEGSVAPAAPQ